MLKLILIFLSLISGNALSLDADPDLELYEYSSLQNSIIQFKSKGGTLIPLGQDLKPFRLEAGDKVYPACSGGNNRSQTLWGILRRYDKIISLQQPHATRFGFDPYNGVVNWHRTRHRVRKDDEFKRWTGFEKSKKIGWDAFENLLSETHVSLTRLEMIKKYYDRHYYNPGIPKNIRRVYITFAANAHVHMYRLSQVNDTLENVYVLYYPIEDLIAQPLPEWGVKPRSRKSYEKLAAMIVNCLDFSKLKAKLD